MAITDFETIDNVLIIESEDNSVDMIFETGGEPNDGANLGNGFQIYKGKEKLTLLFNTIEAGEGILITEKDGSLELSANLNLSPEDINITDSDNIPEGQTNLYYTPDRAKSDASELAITSFYNHPDNFQTKAEILDLINQNQTITDIVLVGNTLIYTDETGYENDIDLSNITIRMDQIIDWDSTDLNTTIENEAGVGMMGQVLTSNGDGTYYWTLPNQVEVDLDLYISGGDFDTTTGDLSLTLNDSTSTSAAAMNLDGRYLLIDDAITLTDVQSLIDADSTSHFDPTGYATETYVDDAIAALSDLDEQTLFFNDTSYELTISKGNTVDLSALLSSGSGGTDNQTLTWDELTNTLTISNSNSQVIFPDWITATDAQTLIDAAVDGLADTDNQTLSFDGSNLTISGGNTVNLTGLMPSGLTSTDQLPEGSVNLYYNETEAIAAVYTALGNTHYTKAEIDAIMSNFYTKTEVDQAIENAITEEADAGIF